MRRSRPRVAVLCSNLTTADARTIILAIAATGPARDGPRRLGLKLPIPRWDLVPVNLVSLRQIGQARLLPNRLQGDLRLHPALIFRRVRFAIPRSVWQCATVCALYAPVSCSGSPSVAVGGRPAATHHTPGFGRTGMAAALTMTLQALAAEHDFGASTEEIDRAIVDLGNADFGWAAVETPLQAKLWLAFAAAKRWQPLRISLNSRQRSRGFPERQIDLVRMRDWCHQNCRHGWVVEQLTLADYAPGEESATFWFENGA
jgi:hypothetical protein